MGWDRRVVLLTRASGDRRLCERGDDRSDQPGPWRDPRLHERRLRRVSREADFMQLATWFADRLRTLPTSCGTRQPDCGAPGTSTISPATNPSIGVDRSGMPDKPSSHPGCGHQPGGGAPAGQDVVPTTAPSRRRPRASQGRGRAGEAARNASLQRTPTRLSDMGQLDVNEFSAFLDVLGTALAEHA